MSGRIVIGGCIAQKPYQAGHTWQYLQYLLGFRRLGYDGAVSRPAGRAGRRPATGGLGYLRDVFAEAGLDGCWTVGARRRRARRRSIAPPRCATRPTPTCC